MGYLVFTLIGFYTRKRFVYNADFVHDVALFLSLNKLQFDVLSQLLGLEIEVPPPFSCKYLKWYGVFI